MKTCPEADQLKRLLSDKLSEDEQSRIGSHVGICSECQGELDRLSAETPLEDLLRAKPGVAPESFIPSHFLNYLEQNNPLRQEGAETNRGDGSMDFGPPTDKGALGQIASYHIVKELGRGGMGIVYLAMDGRFNREVALKVLKPQFAAVERYRKRFEHEAKKAATVKDDHVVTVYDTGTVPGLGLPGCHIFLGLFLGNR
jgi:hypothetical protein